MIYTTDVPRLGEGETSAVTLGKFDGAAQRTSEAHELHTGKKRR